MNPRNCGYCEACGRGDYSKCTTFPITKPGEAELTLPFAILPDELEALHRFYETCEDGQDYDVPLPMMKRLAVIGLVRRVTGNRYEFTDFGISVRNGDFAAALGTAPATPVPASELSDEAIRAGIRAFQSGHNGSDDLSDWRAFYREVHRAIATPTSPAPAPDTHAPIEPVKVADLQTRALRMADMALASWENGYAFDSHGPSRETQRLVREALEEAVALRLAPAVAGPSDEEILDAHHELMKTPRAASVVTFARIVLGRWGQAPATQADAAEVGQWRPIESAPKDDTVLLTDGYTVGEGFWHDGSECYGHRGGEGWFWESDRGDLLIASNAGATHWQPMPAPPAPADSSMGGGER